MGKGKSAAPRAARRPKKKTHHKGFIAQATSAVRKVALVPVKVAGPLLIGAGGLMLAGPAIEGAVRYPAGVYRTPTAYADYVYGNTAPVALPGAALVIGGVILTKAVGGLKLR
jgi:hypothetical protein